MNIKKVWAIYFSPTGTTQKVVSTLAEELAKSLNAEIDYYDFTLPQARKNFAPIAKEDLVVFGTPTYAGRVPNVLLKYLETIKGNGALAIPVATFGNRAFDNSLIELRDILENGDFHTIAATAVSCEHSFSYELGAGKPDNTDISQITDFAKRVSAKIATSNPIDTTVTVDGIPETYGGYYKPQDRNGTHIDIRKVTPKVSDACTKCGICAEVCPMGSIDPTDVSQMRGICIKCGACFKKCPIHARYFDDEGYLYHKTELEELYARRAQNSFFI